MTLTGHVRSYAEKCIAERIALRVRGVRGVVERIAVRYPDNPRIGDEALADRCARVLEWGRADSGKFGLAEGRDGLHHTPGMCALLPPEGISPT
ncbi:BON domain-containing protein [Methylobacterium isbiliense]|nr:BON domain-containing protein [Methylobacterium isbiliense]MDN3626480.1 BON domain-containing protein [Methylobacterium isbiliense]